MEQERDMRKEKNDVLHDSNRWTYDLSTISTLDGSFLILSFSFFHLPMLIILLLVGLLALSLARVPFLPLSFCTSLTAETLYHAPEPLIPRVPLQDTQGWLDKETVLTATGLTRVVMLSARAAEAALAEDVGTCKRELFDVLVGLSGEKGRTQRMVREKVYWKTVEFRKTIREKEEANVVWNKVVLKAVGKVVEKIHKGIVDEESIHDLLEAYYYCQKYFDALSEAEKLKVHEHIGIKAPFLISSFSNLLNSWAKGLMNRCYSMVQNKEEQAMKKQVRDNFHSAEEKDEFEKNYL